MIIPHKFEILNILINKPTMWSIQLQRAMLQFGAQDNVFITRTKYTQYKNFKVERQKCREGLS